MLLKGIPSFLTGDALKVLRDMGHADELIVADGNFSSEADAIRPDGSKKPVVWLTGYSTLEIVWAVLEMMPLDHPQFGPPGGYIVEGDEPEDAPLREVSNGFNSHINVVRAQWENYAGTFPDLTEPIPREEFHEVARKAYAIFATNDRKHYACFRLRKGSLPEMEEL